jgi:hypothetical protein
MYTFLLFQVVVDSTSAIIGLAGHREQVLELDRDHRQICKLAQGPDFNRVARHLKRLADSAIMNIGPLDLPQTSSQQGQVNSDIVCI